VSKTYCLPVNGNNIIMNKILWEVWNFIGISRNKKRTKCNRQCTISFITHFTRTTVITHLKKNFYSNFLSVHFCSLQTRNICQWYMSKINPHLAVVPQGLWRKCNCVETADKYQLWTLPVSTLPLNHRSQRYYTITIQQ